MLNASVLDQIIATTPSFVGQTDAQVAAAAVFTTPVLTPNVGPFTWVTLASSAYWGAAKTNLALTLLQSAAASGTSGAALAITALTVGINPQDSSSQALISALGAMLILASAASATPIVQGDIDAISSTSSYRTGDLPQASDVTAARARITARASVAAAQAAIAVFSNAARSSNKVDGGGAALAALKSAVAAA